MNRVRTLGCIVAVSLAAACGPAPQPEEETAAGAELQLSRSESALRPRPPAPTAIGIELRPLDFLIDWQAEPTYLGVYLAKALGSFEQLGLNVEIIQSWGANAATAAVAAGRYKIATASGGATVLATSQGADLVSTAVIYQRLPTVVYGLAAQDVDAPGDLAGKTVGIYPQSITRNEFDAFLRIAGIPADDVDVVSISGPDLPLVLSGQADAAVNYFELSPTQLGLQEETFQLALDEYGVEGYGLNIITSRETYENDRPLIDGITAAVVDAYRTGCADQAAAVQTFLNLFPEKDPDYVDASWAGVCAFIGGDVGHQTPEGWQTTIDLYRAVGLIDEPVTPADVLPPSRS